MHGKADDKAGGRARRNREHRTEILCHPFPPLFDADSRVLILGSFPSVKSREQRFFYGHPQNRFWKVMAEVVREKRHRPVNVPASIPEKRAFLLENHIALWDVIASCEITGSSDASIKTAVPTDLSPILEGADIRAIFCNGAKAFALFEKHHAACPVAARSLPSTSPANAAWSAERLLDKWRAVGEYL